MRSKVTNNSPVIIFNFSSRTSKEILDDQTGEIKADPRVSLKEIVEFFDKRNVKDLEKIKIDRDIDDNVILIYDERKNEKASTI